MVISKIFEKVKFGALALFAVIVFMIGEWAGIIKVNYEDYKESIHGF